MLPREARTNPPRHPGTSPAVDPLLPPESPRKGLYIKPTIERDGFAIHPAASNREQLIRDRLDYIGTPQPTYEGLVFAYEHNLFGGIDPKEWNATVTYYTTARSMEHLAKSAREEFGLNLASMWPMAKVFSRTMKSIKTNLLSHGHTPAEAINPDQRKNMQAGIYKERQQKAVGTQEARDAKRTRMLAEPIDSKRRRRSSETLKKQRQDPEFLAKLLAAEPRRIAKITTTWRRKAGHPDMPLIQTPTPAIPETTVELPQIIAEPPPREIAPQIPDTPEVQAAKQLIALDAYQRHVLTGQTYTQIQAFREQGLLTVLHAEQPGNAHHLPNLEMLTPFMQGFLLVKHLTDKQGIKITLSPTQGENLVQKLGNKDIAARLFTYLQADEQLFKQFVNLAHVQFAFPPDTDMKTLGERVKQQNKKNKQDFLYGIAVMYFLASHAEKQAAE